jgi:hypothetical protein
MRDRVWGFIYLHICSLDKFVILAKYLRFWEVWFSVNNLNVSHLFEENMKGYILILLLSIVTPSSVEASLLFYEPFDNETTIINNGGTITGTPTFLPGIVENAVNLSGSTRVMYSMIDNFNRANGTIQFWVWSPNQNHLGYWDIGLLSRPNSWGIFKNANHMIMETKSSSNSYDQAWSPFPVPYDGKWHFISCPFERVGTTTYFKICVDGKCKASYDGIVNNTNPSETGNFYVGWNYWYGYSNSHFDEFKIYDHAKSNEEILDDYQNYVKNIPKECKRDKPDSTGRVKINCAGLFINDKPFTVKGVGYQPIPIGKTAESTEDRQEMYKNKDIRERDFPLLRNMNANSIRTWSEVLSKSWLDDLFNNGTKSIDVLMGFWINCHENYGDQTIRQKYINKFSEYVNEYKDHPAVLAWLLGNENNLSYCSSPDYIDDFYSLCNELGQIAFEIEGDEYHPVGIVNGDLWNIGVEAMNSDDDFLIYIDFWGINVYPGESFGSWFEEYKLLSGKPLLITEYGIDALDNSKETEYQETHAEWVLNQWHEIDQADVTIGSTLMEYSDEWWKAGNPSLHDNGGYPTERHPDGYSNEEWWGVMRTIPEGQVDKMEKRQVYYDLQKVWKEPPNLSFIPLLLYLIEDETQ